jgi:hypothetical protein
MHGQISIIEAITTIIILFTSLSIFLPPFSYESRWGDAMLLVRARDVTTTADRLGILYSISFNSTTFSNFLRKTVPAYITYWSRTDNAIKGTVTIACNCTDEQIEQLTNWTQGLMLNDRNIKVEVCKSYLGVINPCYLGSDALLIWGYQNLSLYLPALRRYSAAGNGIVMTADLNETYLDAGTKEVFGLKMATTPETSRLSDYDRFRLTPCNQRPCNASDVIYQAWKYFYHIPVPVFTQSLPPGNVQMDDGSLHYCSELSNSSFKIQSYVYQEDGNKIEAPYAYEFWVCNLTTVYFDTDWNGTADMIVQVGERFNLPNLYNTSENFTFLLSYIDADKIGISFKPDYKFYDFVKYKWGYEIDKPGKGPPEHAVAAGLKNNFAKYYVLAPDDNDYQRILIQAENFTETNEPIPGVILKATPAYRTAWISNFTKGGVGDDERLLITSLLFWASNKKSTVIPYTALGYETSYINVANKDMFEVYLFDLGLGYPR